MRETERGERVIAVRDTACGKVSRGEKSKAATQKSNSEIRF